ncbi:MAG TPA: uridine kinase, partial [Thermotogales bacterium]|nr:uridine kinase [Thermotogales bacterium]
MVTYRREKGIFNEVEPKDLIVVEGLFVIYTAKLRSLFDFKVYVDAPADERLIRRIERDTKERGRSIDSILKQYRKFVAPSFRTFIEPQKYYCDLVLPWGGENKVGLSIIINAIENLLKRGERAES